MIRVFAPLLVTFMGLSAFAGGGVVVGNGAGFAEFLLMKIQPELPERFEFTARMGTCTPEATQALIYTARTLRVRPVPLKFVSPQDYALSVRLPGTLTSTAYTSMHVRPEAIVLDRWAASFWTDERTVLDVLAESNLLRMGVPPATREQARSCLSTSSQQRYVTSDLKSFRQQAVGVVGNFQGQLVVTDANSAHEIDLQLNCGPFPFLDTKSLGLAARGQTDVRWNVMFRLTPVCAQRVGATGIVVSIDLHFASGSNIDLINGDPRVKLEYQAATAQIVR